MKTKLLTTIFALLAAYCFAGDPKMTIPPKVEVYAPLYRDSEFNVSLLGTGSWTQTESAFDRYLGVDHAFGGTLNAAYFFKKYFGIVLSGSGYDVRNVSTPARVATSSDARRFVGSLLGGVEFRYPIGNTPFAPYGRIGFGGMFNGGNSTLKEPNCTVGCTLQFEKVEHDAKGFEEFAAGIEYRINKHFGLLSEVAFDKVNRPQSNFFTGRVGLNYAF